jgi:hypothetical protein
MPSESLAFFLEGYNGDIVFAARALYNRQNVKFQQFGNNCAGVAFKTTSDEDNTSNSLEAFTVYPNPTSSGFYIKHNLETNNPIQVKLYNLQGQLVYTQSCTAVMGQDCYISKSLANGMYIVKINSNETVYTTKLEVLAER